MKHYKGFVFITVIFLLNICSGADKSPAFDNNNYRLNLRFFPVTFGHLKKVFLSPLYFSRKDWNRAGIILLGTGISYTQDTAVRDYFQTHRTPASDSVSGFFIHFGSGEFSVPILAGLYFYGYLDNKDRYKRAGVLGMESMIVAGVITGAIKLVIQRPLPDSGHPYDIWYSKWSSFDNLAFPSGHTSSVFAFATIIATEFSDNRLVPVLAYTTASLTALSRLNDNVHWASDILPGAALGYYTAKKIEKIYASPESSSLTFFPVVSRGNILFSCFYSF